MSCTLYSMPLMFCLINNNVAESTHLINKLLTKNDMPFQKHQVLGSYDQGICQCILM